MLGYMLFGMALIVALGVPFFMWMSFGIHPPKQKEAQIHRGIEEARTRIGKPPI